MPIIELPNGETAEFPDTMTKDQITSVIRSKFPPKNISKENNSELFEHIKPIVSAPINVARGALQGLANIPPGLYNLGASGVNALGGHLPKSPMFDFAPPGLAKSTGEAASFFLGPGLLKLAGKVPQLSHAASSAMKIPLIAHGIKHASNILTKAPITSKIAGNALLGGAYSPENPLLGLGLGASAGAVGEGLGRGYSSLKNNNVLGHILSNPKSLFTTKKELTNHLLNKHDFLENRASQAFNHVSNEVNSRGINRIPIENRLPDDFFEKAKHFFPKTQASLDLLNKAKTGDYNALRKMQSDLYKRAKKNLSSQFDADTMKGAEMLEKRNDINQLISNHLQETGHDDLSKLLDEARHDWSTLQKTYYNENVSNALIKMFNKDIRKIPKNLANLLSEESIPMKTILDFHPGLEEKIIGHKLGQGALKKIGKYGIPASLAFGGYEFGKHNG